MIPIPRASSTTVIPATLKTRSQPLDMEEDSLYLKRPSLTRRLAIDCEMVSGQFGQNLLARVSIVNEHGACVFDTFARPSEPIMDYRTPWSGVRSQDLAYAPSVNTVRAKVRSLVEGRVLVGHDIRKDLDVLRLDNHPEIRDTALIYKEKLQMRTPPSLKYLANLFLNLDIQRGEHCSVEDATVTMELYLLHKTEMKESWKESVQRQSASKLLIKRPTSISELTAYPAESDNILFRQNIVPEASRSTEHYADVQFQRRKKERVQAIRDRMELNQRNNQLSQEIQINRICSGFKLLFEIIVITSLLINLLNVIFAVLCA